MEPVRWILTRRWKSPLSTLGVITLENNNQLCFTLELPEGDGGHGWCIPEGEFPLTIRHSPRFGKDMPHIEDVPGREGILLHVANYPKDIEGCVGVGETLGKDSIFSSTTAFAKVNAALTSALATGPVSLRVISSPSAGATKGPAKGPAVANPSVT